MTIDITSLSLGPLAAQCYLVTDADSLDTVIIDPGDEASKVRTTISDKRLKPKAILLTHGHIDHMGAAHELQELYEIPLYLHRDEESTMLNANDATVWLPIPPIPIPEQYELIDSEDALTIGSISATPLHTPGHSPGGLTFLIGGHAFVGDSIFDGSIGRTDLGGGSMETLLTSIRNKILTLPPGTILYPGHGPQTSVQQEASSNPFLRCR